MVILYFICNGTAQLQGRETSEQFKMKIYISAGNRTRGSLLSSRKPNPLGYRDCQVILDQVKMFGLVLHVESKHSTCASLCYLYNIHFVDIFQYVTQNSTCL